MAHQQIVMDPIRSSPLFQIFEQLKISTHAHTQKKYGVQSYRHTLPDLIWTKKSVTDTRLLPFLEP